MTKENIKLGTEVKCNGFRGSIIKIHTGQLSGMVDVQLDRGVVCDDIACLERWVGR